MRRLKSRLIRIFTVSLVNLIAGAKLYRALYVNTALFYIKRSGTESHSSLSNMMVDGWIPGGYSDIFHHI